MTTRLITGDCRDVLATLPAESVQCCVTSPPYFGLRDYGVDQQIGLEPTPDAYVAELVAVFREVRRVLRGDGTLWLNLGDSYATGAGKVGNCPGGGAQGEQWKARGPGTQANRMPLPGLKPKDLIGIPWRVAFALQADGWYLRSDIIWAKPNPMPESVRDRPTKAHEYMFLLSKAKRYYYDADAIAEPASSFGRQHATDIKPPKVRALIESGHHKPGGDLSTNYERESRNARSVWTIATQPNSLAHFAIMPDALAERCIKAGSKPGDDILDPFAGAGTTLLAADRLGRSGVGIELSPVNRQMGADRVHNDTPLFAEVAA